MAFENPTSILFDTKGIEVAVSGGQAIEPNFSGSDAQPGIMVAGSSSTGKVRFLHVTEDGDLWITGSVTTAAANNDQGNQGTPDQSWYMVITDGTSSTALGSADASPLWITGTVDTLGPNGDENDPIYVSSSEGSPVWVTGTMVATIEEPLEVTGTVRVEGPQGWESDPIYVSSSEGSPVWVTGTMEAIISEPLEVTGQVRVEGPLGWAQDPIYVTGSFTMAPQHPNPTANVTSVAASTSPVTLQAANASRAGLTIYHPGNKILYVKLGSAPTVSSYTVKLSAQGYYEVPAHYTGIVTGFWDSAGGIDPQALMTEIID